VLRYKDGCYTCIIPENGILHVKGKGPFYRWHSTTATFASGNSIPEGTERLSEDVVAFWHGGSRPGGLLYDFIGTKAELAAFRKEIERDEIRSGGVVEKEQNISERKTAEGERK